MKLSEDLSLIHQPTRLRIMGFLYRYRDVSYTSLRDQLELTDVNLATHTEKLEEAGYLENRRAWASNGFETRFRISPCGVSAFQRYLEEMREFFDEVDENLPAITEQERREEY